MKFTQSYLSKPSNLPHEPVINLMVKNAANESLSSVANFLIDSGADFIVINENLYNSLGLKRKGLLRVAPAFGKKQDKEWSIVKIELPQLKISKKVVAIKTEENHNLLGRNFLNNFCIVLNGLKLEYKIYA